MTQGSLDMLLWTVQTRLTEQVLKPLEKLLHHHAGNNLRFFASAPQSTEKASLTANLHAVSALICAVQSLQASLAGAEKAITDASHRDAPINS